MVSLLILITRYMIWVAFGAYRLTPPWCRSDLYGFHGALFGRTPVLDEQRVPVESRPAEGGFAGATALEIDRGLYLNLTFVADDLEGFAADGVLGMFPTRGDWDKLVDHWVEQSWKSGRALGASAHSQRAKAAIGPANVAALWLIGFEDQPQRSGELCLVEINGWELEAETALVGYGIGRGKIRPCVASDSRRIARGGAAAAHRRRSPPRRPVQRVGVPNSTKTALISTSASFN